MITTESLLEIAQQYGTPSYVFDIDELKRRLSTIRNILGDDIGILYAMKANPFLVRTMKNLGVHFEVCSPGEFAICEKEQVDMAAIVLSGVNKEKSDIDHVMDDCKGVGIYTVESLRQFQLLSSAAAQRRQTIQVLLRVTSGNQFGLDENDVERIVASREEYPFVNIHGIQCYTGTQKKKIEHIEKEIDWLDNLCDRLKAKYGYNTELLEYGPGLPVSYFEPDTDNENYDILKRFAAKLDTIRGKYSISLEMGRYIAATCGVFLTRIEDMKINTEQKYCIVDGGINHINYYGQTMAMKIPLIKHIPMQPSQDKSFECSGAEGRLTDELNASAKGEQNWTICGSLCTVGDVIVKNFPIKDAKPGDMLVFCNIGAYSVTEGIYLFLSRNLPNIITYSMADGARLMRGQEPTYVINSAKC